MTEFKLTKIDAAIDQLDWAIRLLLDHEAYLPAITLAGAAEEMLGKCVQGDSSHTVLKKTLSEQFQLNEKVVADDHLNKAKNWLKHNNEGDPFKTDSFELEGEAVQYIARALNNLILLGRSLPSEGQRFLDWMPKKYRN